MASLTIRNLDESVKARLRMQAARHGWSTEEEVRQILRKSVEPADQHGLARRIHERFADLDADDLPIPDRRPARCAPDMDV